MEVNSFLNFFPVGMIGAFIFLPIIWLIIAILLCVWVYRDAQSRGENAALWLLIVLITGIIGLIIWLIIRPEKKKKRKSQTEERVTYCSNCGTEIDPGTKFCSECGEELER